MSARSRLVLAFAMGALTAGGCTLDRSAGIDDSTGASAPVGPGGSDAVGGFDATGGSGVGASGPGGSGGTGGVPGTGGSGGMTGGGGIGPTGCAANETCVEGATAAYVRAPGAEGCPPEAMAGTETLYSNDPDAAGCTGCTCTAQGGDCTIDIRGWEEASCGGASHTYWQDLSVGDCVDIMSAATAGSTIVTGATSMDITDVTPTVGACQPGVSTKTIPGRSTLCTLPPAAASCGTAGICVPEQQTAPFTHSCVEKGTAPCPAGFTEHTLTPVASDTLSCGCACTATPTPCDGVQVAVYSDAACTMAAANTMTVAEGQCVDTQAALGSDNNYIAVEAPGGGPCTPSDVEMGAVTFGTAATFCCLD